MKIFMSVLFFVAYVFAYDATIELSKSKNKLYKIMVEDASNLGVFSQQFHKMLVGDLQASANFNVIEDYSTSTLDATHLSPKVLEKSAEMLVRFVLNEADGELNSKVRLYNIKSGAVLYDRDYTINSKDKYPFLSHKIVVDLNNETGNASIEWMNRSVVISKYTSPRNSLILLADYTLTYQKNLISGGLNIFPKWGDIEQKTLYYTHYENRTPVLYKYDIYSGNKTKIISSNGMLVCSDVSADGQKLLLTMAPDDQPDVYEYHLGSKSKNKLTNFSGIDVSGQYVDNDSKIVFVSDRMGYPNIFLKSGGGIEQLVYHGKNNSSCTTSGSYIIYSSREAEKDEGGSVFNLYLISTQSEFIRKLTSYGKNSFPRFAKNSDTVLFIKTYKNQSALGLIRLNANYSVTFPLKVGQIQSIDW